MSGTWHPLPEPIPVLACPHCGCTEWRDIESIRGTVIVDISTRQPPSGGEDPELEVMNSDGWICRENRHEAPEDFAELLDWARENVY